MNEEKTNVEKLGEDLKGVVSDVANSEALKNAREKLAEVADSDLAKQAKQALKDAANSEAAKMAKEKISEAANSEFAKSAKAKFDEAVKSDAAQKTKAKLIEEFSNAKSWISENWSKGGYGKFRVIAATVVILLAVRGLFAFWGSSDAVEIARMQKEQAETDAGAALLGALLSGGNGGGSSQSSSHSSGPQEKTWICSQCGNQVRAKFSPPKPKCKAYHGQRDGSCFDKCQWREVH